MPIINDYTKGKRFETLEMSGLEPRQSVSFADSVPCGDEIGSIGLFMIISRLAPLWDHAIFYWFLTTDKGDAPTIKQVAAWAAKNHCSMGDDLVVIDTGERVVSAENVHSRAIQLKQSLQNANVHAPHLVLSTD
ncbi:MAG: hypothetical protein RIC14_05545 [Filomicrobium sp.]